MAHRFKRIIFSRMKLYFKREVDSRTFRFEVLFAAMNKLAALLYSIFSFPTKNDTTTADFL